MERTILSVNLPNTISIGLMAGGLFLGVTLIAQFLMRRGIGAGAGAGGY